MCSHNSNTLEVERKPMSQMSHFSSKVEADNYEKFFTADGEVAGEVAWLRNTERDGRTYKAGMWRADPSSCPYYFAADETFVMIEGILDIELEDGTKLRYGPGDTGSFLLGTNSTWMVVERVVHFFIQTT
jgi:uncharacterized cupin superfamily protein